MISTRSNVPRARGRRASPGGVSAVVATDRFSFSAVLSHVVADFNGSGRTDQSVFRPSSSTWFINNPSTGALTSLNYRASGDVAVPGDYDGDGKTDIAVSRPSVGTWYIHNSSTNADTLLTDCLGSDIPVPGDYDGDGKTDVAIFRPSTGAWYIHNSSNGTDTVITFGISGDVPLPPPNAIRRFFP